MTSPIDPIMLDKLAQVAVKVGLNLQPGQDVVVSGSAETLPLLRRIAVEAYKAGARLFIPLLSDEELTLARFQHGGDDIFDHAADWLYKGMAEAFDGNAARLAISGDNPMLMAQQDPDRVSRANRALSKAYRPAAMKISNFDINWSICAYPGRSWAKQVFPDIPEDDAVAKLAKAIFAASRVDQPDPVAAWAAHSAALHARAKWLDDMDFAALHFTGGGNDLTVGLAEGHRWVGGGGKAKNGIECMANIPTEEVFTTPHRHKVEGVARASKPLAHQGTLIENIEVRFEAGRIVEARASKGEAVLKKLLDTDEGAARIGEVALVPHSSPISQSGVLFYNTLFDENAACHIALGRCYSECFKGHFDAEEVMRRGGNDSLIHVDWMIGSAETDIDGITQDGKRVAVFRKGEWAS